MKSDPNMPGNGLNLRFGDREIEAGKGSRVPAPIVLAPVDCYRRDRNRTGLSGQQLDLCGPERNEARPFRLHPAEFLNVRGHPGFRPHHYALSRNTANARREPVALARVGVRAEAELQRQVETDLRYRPVFYGDPLFHALAECHAAQGIKSRLGFGEREDTVFIGNCNLKRRLVRRLRLSFQPIEPHLGVAHRTRVSAVGYPAKDHVVCLFRYAVHDIVLIVGFGSIRFFRHVHSCTAVAGLAAHPAAASRVLRSAQ